MYTRMVRAFVGIGSVDTVVAPDSALVGQGAKTIKKNTNSTQNKSQTHRAKQ